MSIPGAGSPLFIGAAAGAAAAFKIDRSLRFNSGDSAYLNKTFSTAGNSRTWTWSCWIKLNGDSDSAIFQARAGIGTNPAFTFRINDGYVRAVYRKSDGSTVRLQTNRILRDFSSWYHLLLAVDTTQATSSNRTKIYVNGTQETSFSTAEYPGQNLDSAINNAISHQIGQQYPSSGSAGYSNQYLAEIHFVDGQALAATDFGEYDSNNVWQPKEFAGTYGTNGFYLKFADNSSNAALGTDSSGNSNTFTVNNLVATVGADGAKGFKTLTYTGNGGTQTIGGLAFQPDLVWAKNRSSSVNHHLVDSVRGAESSKVLYPNLTNAEGATSSFSAFTSDGFSVGSNDSVNKNNENIVAWCWNAGANSNKTYTVKVVSDSGNKYRFDDFGTSAVTLDLQEGSTYVFDQSDSSNAGHPIRFGTSANGTDYTTGVTHTGTPGSAGAKTTLVLGTGVATLYYSCANHSGMGGQINTNSTAGASNFDGSIQANVKANAEHGFSIVTWSGTSANATIGHGLNAAVEWIILKRRDSGTTGMYVYHSAVSPAKTLYLYGTTAAETYAAAYNNTASTNSVFSVGSAAATNSGNMVAYCWSEVSGFSKFGSYAGDGSTKTITTGFKPAFILSKSYDTGSNWHLLDSKRGSAWLEANGSAAENSNSNIVVTYLDNGFTVNGSNINNSGTNYVYMAFAGTPDSSVIDSLIDTPTNYTAGSGNNGGNYCVMNPLDMKSNVATQNGNLEVSNATAGWSGIRGTLGFSSGKWYYELETETASIFAGIATAGVDIFANAPQDSTSVLDDGALIYCDDGKYLLDQGGSANRQTYGSALANGDILGVAFDLDGNTVQFYKNGSALGSIDISSSPLASNTVLPYYISYYTSTTTFFNFGQRPFAYTPPTGYKSLCTANLDDPTIADGSTAFDIALWSGTGSSNAITSLNTAPDFVWIKSRNSTGHHTLVDAVRGPTKALFSNRNVAQVTDAGYLSSFDSNGFTVVSDNDVNGSSYNYVGWAWDAGTSTVSNTDGSITSSVRANPTAGFSIMEFSMPTVTTATIGHGLNAAPTFFIWKDRDTTSDWYVYHKDAETRKYLTLNTTNTANTDYGAWNNTAPTSTVIHTGNTFSNTGSTVVYAFSPVAGYSAFGSYTGNGDADGPFIYTGFRPKFILRKQTNSAQHWHIADAERDPENPSDSWLFPNLSDAEGSGDIDRYTDILSNGFKIRSAYSYHNQSGSTYIYAAFAEHPQKTARAR